MKKKYLYLCILFFINSCVEQIDIDNFSYEDFLVVEAAIDDELKYNIIKLQRTIPLDSNTYKPESNAEVSIIENNGNVYSFTETVDGTYISNIKFKANLENTYKLKIKTINGEQYESTSQKIEGTNNIDEITTKIETDRYGTEGVSIIINSKTDNKDAKYYKYTYEETYKIKAPRWSPYKLTIISETKPFIVRKDYDYNALDRKICYNTISSKNIIQTEVNSLNSNRVIFPLRFIDKEDFIISRRYSIIVNQYVQSYHAYIYYKTLNKLSSSSSVFTSNQPGFIQGNIFNTSDNTKKILGFFEVNSVSKKRIFFNHIDLFPDHSYDFDKDCHKVAPSLYEAFSPFSPLIDYLNSGFYYYNDNNDRTEDFPGLYFLSNLKCTDCRVLGTNIKPAFWVD